MGESDSQNRAVEAIEKAIENPLLDIDITGATGALINIIGGSDLTLDETKRVIETVSQRLNPDSKIIWGAQISEDMQNTLRVMLIITGVRSPQIVGHGDTQSDRQKAEIARELGIEFVE